MTQTIKELIEIASVEIDDIGIFWYWGTRTPNSRIASGVQARFPGLSLVHMEPAPDFDMALIDGKRHPEYHTWLSKHSEYRTQLKEEGVTWDKLPPLPRGARPLDKAKAYGDEW